MEAAAEMVSRSALEPPVTAAPVASAEPFWATAASAEQVDLLW
jgi:hypothetical protein